LQRSASFNVLRNTPANNLLPSSSADVINESYENQKETSDAEETEEFVTVAEMHQEVGTYNNGEDGMMIQTELYGSEEPADMMNGIGQPLSDLPRRTVIG